MELNQVLKVIHKTALGFIESEDEDVMTSRDLSVTDRQIATMTISNRAAPNNLFIFIRRLLFRINFTEYILTDLMRFFNMFLIFSRI